MPVKLATPDAEEFGAALGLLVDLVFGEPHHQALVAMRLQAFLDALGPMELTDAQARIASSVNARVEALVQHSFQGIGEWQTMLRSVANQLEDLERRAKIGRPGQDERSTMEELVSRQLRQDEQQTDNGGKDS